MDSKCFEELCPDCKAKCEEMGEGPDEGSEDEEMGMDGEGEPSKKPLKSMDEADGRGMMRIMIGLGKGAGKGTMKDKFGLKKKGK